MKGIEKDHFLTEEKAWMKRKKGEKIRYRFISCNRREWNKKRRLIGPTHH